MMRHKVGINRYVVISGILLSIFSLSTVYYVPPTTVLAEEHEGSGLLPECGGKDQPECGYKELETLVINVMNYLVILSTIIATGVFAYAGLKLITSGGDTGARDEAKKMLTKVVIGFVIILSAWVIVYTITNTLLEEEYVLLGS